MLYNEAFALFVQRYDELKEKTQRMQIPARNLSDALDNIEKEITKDPVQAQIMLKDLQNQYGLAAEFSKVSDRYNEIKKRIIFIIDNASQNFNNIQSQNNSQNILKNNIHHTIIDNVNSIHDVLPYVKENTLVIFDVDDTLIGHHWATDRRILLENEIMKTLQTIYNEGGHVIAVTSRGIESDTKDQLATAGIYLDKFSVHKFKSKENLQKGSGYKESIFYTALTPKSNAIPQIVDMYHEAYGLLPKRIIFIDDLKEHVEQVIKATRDLSIDSVGIVYTRGEALQWENYNYIQNMG